MKAQSSIEYLMIIGLAMLIIVPTTYLFFSYSGYSQTKITDSQAVDAGMTIIQAAETVFFSGEDSKIVVEVQIPETVSDIYILDYRELVFNVTSPFGNSELVFLSSVNITNSSQCTTQTCSLENLVGQGIRKIELLSMNNGDQVQISKK